MHRVCIFQPPDLYEGRNMQMVLSCIQALGTEVIFTLYVFRQFPIGFLRLQLICYLFGVTENIISRSQLPNK